jgi:hypothetical protein
MGWEQVTIAYAMRCEKGEHGELERIDGAENLSSEFS